MNLIYEEKDVSKISNNNYFPLLCNNHHSTELTLPP